MYRIKYTLIISINNINAKRNYKYFNSNFLGEKTIQADGFTTTLKANLVLQACQTYRIKLAIADVGDRTYDSWVFIEAGSFQHKTNLGRDTFICMDNFDVELDAGNPGISRGEFPGETKWPVAAHAARPGLDRDRYHGPRFRG